MSDVTVAAGGRNRPTGVLTYEDVQVGDWFETGERLIDIAMIDAFADLTGDRFEIHMDAAAACRHGFKGRVAHGLLVLSLTDGLKNQAQAHFQAAASLGWNFRFEKPVLEGDRIKATVAVRAMRTTSRPDRGILTLHFSVTNQNGEVVQSGENQLMVYRRS